MHIMQNMWQRSKVPTHVHAVFDEKGAAFELQLSSPKKSLSYSLLLLFMTTKHGKII